jgi:CelD/BcsL family acetyltransferase involved in cellulose biosynthesis
MITLQLVCSEREFFALGDVWDDLLARSNMTVNKVFYTFEFMRLWWNFFSSDYELLILLAKDANNPVGIIPLVKHQNGKIVEIRLLGDKSIDYEDFIVTGQREQCIDSILDFLSQEVVSWDLFSLNNIPFESPNFRSFEKQAKSRGRWIRLEEFEKAPYIKINTDWNTFYGSVHKGMRNDTHRQLRRLQEKGELDFGRCQSIEEVPVLMNKMFEYKNKRYKDTGKKGVYAEKRMRDFHLNLAQELWRKGWMDISYVRLNEEVIAVHFGSIYQGKFYYWMPAFNSDYEKFSSSRILLLDLLKRAFREGFCEFDFGFGQESYKYQWTQQDRLLYRFLYFNRTAKGLLLREWFHLWRGFVRKDRKLTSIFRSVEKIITEG